MTTCKYFSHKIKIFTICIVWVICLGWYIYIDGVYKRKIQTLHEQEIQKALDDFDPESCGYGGYFDGCNSCGIDGTNCTQVVCDKLSQYQKPYCLK